jgi:Peptidase M50B-like
MVTTSTTVLGTLGVAIIVVTVLWRSVGWPVVVLPVIGVSWATQLFTGARFKTLTFWSARGDLRAITFDKDRGWWLSRMLTALISLPAPSVVGLLLARGVVVGWSPRTVLITLLVLFGLLVLGHANWYTLLVITAIGGVLALLVTRAGPQAQLGAVILLAWIFLLGGLRLIIHEAGEKHPSEGGSFPGILQRHTDVPSIVWMLGFLLIAIAATVAGARWLLY